MKSKGITLMLISAALAGCGNNVKNRQAVNDTTYQNGHMVVTHHGYAGAREGEGGVTRGGFGETAGGHSSGHGAGE